MTMLASASGYLLLLLGTWVMPRGWRRLPALAPLLSAVLVASIPPPPGPAPGFAQGWMIVTPLLVAGALCIGGESDRANLRTVALAGMLVAVLLGQDDVLLTGSALLLAAGLFAVGWITGAPGKVALAGPRSLGIGAAAFAALVVLLPLPPDPAGLQPQLAALLLLIAAAPGLVVMPLGGWFIPAYNHLGRKVLTPWLYLYVPALFYVVATSDITLPAVSQNTFALIAVPLACASAVWLAIGMLFRAHERHARLLSADLCLALAGVAVNPIPALLPATLVIVMHLAAAPLLGTQSPANKPLRLCGWLLLSGLPPAPSFWARFMLISAVWTVNSSAALAVATVACALVPLSLFAGAAAEARDKIQPPGMAARLLPIASTAFLLYLGLAPQSLLHQAFGL